MSLRDAFGAIDALILPQGFRRRGHTYYGRAQQNRTAIHFVSPGADPDFFTFTAHLGVQSARISAVLGPRLVDGVPSVNGPHHWYRWAGDLNDPNQPTSSWSVERIAGSWNLEVALRDLAQVVMPSLKQHESDQGLRDTWLAQPDTWLSEATQLAYLVVLVRDLGPPEALEVVTSRLKQLVQRGDAEAKGLAETLDKP